MHARGYPGRDDAEKQTRKQGGAKRKQQETPIKGKIDFSSAGAELLGHPIIGPDGNQDAEAAAGARKEAAFCDEGPDQLGAGRAQGTADGEFSRPGDGAREQEIGQVRARNQEHESRKANEHEDNLLAGALKHGHERHLPQVLTLVFLRVAFGETGRDRGKAGRGLSGGDPRTIAPDDVKGMVLPALELFRGQRQGTVDLSRAEGPGIVGQGGCHTDDFVRLSVDPHGFAHDFWVSGKV